MLILTQLGFNVSEHKGHDTGSLKDLLNVTAQAILEVRARISLPYHACHIDERDRRAFTSMQVFILCLVGYIGGKKGAIDAKTKRTLNKVSRCLAVLVFTAE